jgi:hypothetical protein
MEDIATATNSALAASKNTGMEFSVVLGVGTPPSIIVAMVVIIGASGFVGGFCVGPNVI